jgi:hypothetical protein
VPYTDQYTCIHLILHVNVHEYINISVYIDMQVNINQTCTYISKYACMHGYISELACMF